MKQFLLRGLLTAMALLSTTGAVMAYDFEVDKMTFNIISGENNAVELYSYYGDKSRFYLPEDVAYNGKTYKIVSIRDNAFTYNLNVEIITLIGCKGLRSIGDYAFSACYNLKEVAIPDWVSSIGEYLFMDCTSLEEVQIGDGVKGTLNYGIFYGCFALKKVYIGSGITKIGDGFFAWMENLEVVGLGEGLQEIGSWAFRNCPKLNMIGIPTTLKTIGEGAFINCPKLYIQMNEGDSPYFSTWGGVLFDKAQTTLIAAPGCGIGNDLDIPSTVTTIGAYAYWGNPNAPGYTRIPSTVTTIEKGAFGHCANWGVIEIPASVTTIGENIMEGCESLHTIKVAEDNPNYASYNKALYNKELTELLAFPAYNSSVEFPENLTTIGAHAFAGAEKITSIKFPLSLNSIGNQAFQYCPNLTSIELPGRLKEIGDYAFCECIGLPSLTIPNSVTNIGEGAFSWCESLENAVLGSAVENIGADAFYGCELLGEVISLSPVPPVFSNEYKPALAPSLKSPKKQKSSRASDYAYGFSLATFDNGILKVPSGSVDLYKSTEPWSFFSDIIGDDFSGIGNPVTDNLRVSVSGNEIIIEGEILSEVSIYTLNGMLVYSGKCNSFVVNAKGVYVIKVNDRVFKVVI